MSRAQRASVVLAVLLATFILASPPVGAQGSTADEWVLVGATVHTATGKVIEEGEIVIGAQGKILHVGAKGSASSTGRRVDVSGKLITPGLIDPQTTLGLQEISQEPPTVDHSASKRRVRAAFRTADGFNPMSLVIPVTRTGGITSVVIAPRGGLVSGQAGWVDLGAPTRHAVLVDPSVSLHINLGEAGSAAAGGARGEAVMRIRELYDDAAFYARNPRAFDENRSRVLVGTRLDLAAVARTVEGKVPVVFAANRASDIALALDIAKEVGVKPIISGGTEAWMVAAELAEAQVPVVIHPMMNLPSSFERLGAREDNAALLENAGVHVAFSTFGAHEVRGLRQLAGNAIRAGMSFEGALRAVTVNAARCAQKDSEYGTLEPGKVANLVVWSADPFEISSRPEMVVIRGRRVSLESRQELLLERYRVLPRRRPPLAPDAPPTEKR